MLNIQYEAYLMPVKSSWMIPSFLHFTKGVRHRFVSIFLHDTGLPVDINLSHAVFANKDFLGGFKKGRFFLRFAMRCLLIIQSFFFVKYRCSVMSQSQKEELEPDGKFGGGLCNDVKISHAERALKKPTTPKKLILQVLFIKIGWNTRCLRNNRSYEDNSALILAGISTFLFYFRIYKPSEANIKPRKANFCKNWWKWLNMRESVSKDQ